MTKVYGDRICPICRGICHGQVLRTKRGKRRRYFDTERCVRRYLEKRLGFTLSDREWAAAYPRYFEMVFEMVEVV